MIGQTEVYDKFWNSRDPDLFCISCAVRPNRCGSHTQWRDNRTNHSQKASCVYISLCGAKHLMYWFFNDIRL